MQNCFNLNDNCVVDGVIITCPSRTNGVSNTSGDNGISVVGKKNIKVVNCLFKNWICSGVYLQDSFYCSVSNNTFTGANWDLTNPGSSGVSSDILIYSGTAGGGHVITENICLSNNSQGILCSAIGFDTDTTISNNVCITRNTDGTEPAIGTGIGGVGYLNRRHGIVVSYGGSSSSGRMTVTGNVCRRTLVTGIYVACSITLQKGVTVVGNVCSQNGYATASDSTLAGGISINGGGSGIIVASNVIEDFQGVASTGAINVISNADSETLVTGNLVNNSVRNGIRVYGASHNVTVSHNHIVGSGDYDIGLELASGAKGIRILDNCCIRKNSSSQSLRYDQIGSGSLVVIRGNRFAGFSNSASLHVAIFLVHTNDIEVAISGNDIRRFQRAILINAGATSRLVSKIKVENNNIDDCTFGFSGTHTNGIIPAVQNNFSSSVTTKYQPDGDCAFVETVAINDGKLIVHGTAAPTGRAWVVGDRVINSNPSVGQPKSWVCTVPGTPGTWVSEGNL
jgi:parallel beta-helix repeat protein